MAGLRFEWDAAKAEANRRKHGVSFEEARTVFFDEHALFMADPEHSEEEIGSHSSGSASGFERWWSVTVSGKGRTWFGSSPHGGPTDRSELNTAGGYRDERELRFFEG